MADADTNDERPPTLVLDALVSGYGKKPVVNGVSLRVHGGELLALIGHNGAGKSTLLKAVFGLLPVWEGRVAIGGVPSGGSKPRDLLRSGVAYVPQGNRVFTDLTVRENLEMSAAVLSRGVQVEDRVSTVLGVFPALTERLKQRAGTLSGGEKQMLALGSALVSRPRLLMLDEPSLGLAPPLISDAFERIRRIAASDGVAVLIVEQKVRAVLEVAHSVCVLRNGLVSYYGAAGELRNEDRLREVYL